MATRVAVSDHGAERPGEGALSADDVVVHAAHEGARLRPGEERDRHALHVVEELDPQVEDEALADA
jgi:hypothetical protein